MQYEAFIDHFIMRKHNKQSVIIEFLCLYGHMKEKRSFAYVFAFLQGKCINYLFLCLNNDDYCYFIALSCSKNVLPLSVLVDKINFWYNFLSQSDS